MGAPDKAQIIIVDDEAQMLFAMETVLTRLGHSVLKCESGRKALETLESGNADLVISDMRMPEMGGDELLVKIKERYCRVPVVMITAYGTISQAVEAMRNGAFDFITKPFAAEDLEEVVGRALKPARKQVTIKSTRTDLREVKAIITKDPELIRILEIASTIANSSASVLIQGESGTGKELIAKLIHQSSRRSSGPFVAVNCAALPGNLLESELFGYEKGAFTGAVDRKPGKFELAHNGSILLDEISEMDEGLQAKLLRVLQEREVDRVGGVKPIPIDVRVIATTNRDIRKAIRDQSFREDLYYRLNVIPLVVPPLRERKGDVRLLLEHFVRKYSEQQPNVIPETVMAELEKYAWPGNVRELQNACERAVLLAPKDVHALTIDHFLLGSIQALGDSGSDALRLLPGLSVWEAEKRLILETLRSTENNRTKAAELLGISIRTLRNKLHEYSEQGEAISDE